MNLLMAPLNTELELARMRPIKSKAHLDKHLTNMGFVKGATLSVVSEVNGDFIVKIKDCRVGIGRDIAKNILVREKVK